MTAREGFVKNSVQTTFIFLTKIKGMTKAQAIIEIEAILRVKLPEEIIERLEV